MKCNLVSINEPILLYEGKFQDFIILIVILSFYLSSQEFNLKQIDILTWMYRFFFLNDLELKPIIQRINNKIRKKHFIP